MSPSFRPSHLFKSLSKKRSTSQVRSSSQVPPLPAKEVDLRKQETKKGHFWNTAKVKPQPPSPGISTTCSSLGSPRCVDEIFSEEEISSEAGDPWVVLLDDVNISDRQWERALTSRSVFDLSHKELRQLVRVGVPELHRSALWARCATTSPPHISSLHAIDDLQVRVPKSIASQIDLDVPRTHSNFMSVGNQRTLGRLLRAYAAHTPSVGYCQGINNLAAMFIRLGFDEACAFQCLCSLIDDCCPDYHTPDLCGLRRDALVLERMVLEILPEGTAQRVDDLGVPIDVLMSEHFLCLASSAWPFEATVQLWDVIFLEKQPAVFASFLAILQLFLPSESDIDIPCAGLPGMPEEADEPFQIFQRNVRRGVIENLDVILRTTQEFIAMLPQQLIETFRADAAVKLN